MEEFPELEEELRDALKIIKKKKPAVIADKRKRDDIANTVLTQVLSEKLVAYPTSAEEDRALLEEPDISHRHRMAIQVRLGEKALLEEALAMLKGRTTDSPTEHAERPTKKARR
jgi:SET domain-containing protein 6